MPLFSRSASDRRNTQGAPDCVRPYRGITFYGCERDEAALLRERAPRHYVVPTVTDVAVSHSTLELIGDNRCISVGHKSRISPSLLLALSRSGVQYISTRSAGYNHIDMQAAERLGISVGNVAYSPDSVADYTLMLMLMAAARRKNDAQPHGSA